MRWVRFPPGPQLTFSARLVYDGSVGRHRALTSGRSRAYDRSVVSDRTQPTIPVVIRRRKRWDGEVEWTAEQRRTLTFRLRVWWATVRRERHRHRPAREPRLGTQEIQILAFVGTILVAGSAAWLLIISWIPDDSSQAPAPAAVGTMSPSPSPSLLVVPLTPRAPAFSEPTVVASSPAAPRTSVAASSGAADSLSPVATATTQGTPGTPSASPTEPPPSDTPSPDHTTDPPVTGSASPTATESTNPPLAGMIVSMLSLTPGANL